MPKIPERLSRSNALARVINVPIKTGVVPDVLVSLPFLAISLS